MCVNFLGPEWALAPDFLTILDFSVVKFPHTYGTYIYVLSANSCLPGDPKWRSPKGDSPKGDSPKGDSPKGDLAHIVTSIGIRISSVWKIENLLKMDQILRARVAFEQILGTPLLF